MREKRMLRTLVHGTIHQLKVTGLQPGHGQGPNDPGGYGH
jgi:hypothetical protein